MDVPVPIAVKPLSDYRIWIKYSDGAEGEVDFSYLAGKGVFSFWNDYRNFEKVYISEAGAIAWSANIEVRLDATVHRNIRQANLEILFPSVQTVVGNV